MRFRIRIDKIRPSGHEMNAYKAEFGCPNAGYHLKDILTFLEQLETECPKCMKPVQLRFGESKPRSDAISRSVDPKKQNTEKVKICRKNREATRWT